MTSYKVQRLLGIILVLPWSRIIIEFFYCIVDVFVLGFGTHGKGRSFALSERALCFYVIVSDPRKALFTFIEVRIKD